MTPPDLSAVAVIDDEQRDDTPEALPLGFIVGGKYRIKRVLGMGGNGAVYEGQHATVGHRVAIKVVHPKLAEREETGRRFQREAQICGSLQHPNVGQVYDVGTLDDGAPYMVMELLEGRSLADVINETKVPIAAVIEIVRQVLAGLAAAHRSGTIHRDIKPDNVMIVRDHSGDVLAKLVDFGISKPIVKSRSEHSVTDAGVIIGSPDYMSPEQLRGDDVDLRTDLYSAGVLLYEAITGRLPFDHAAIVDLFAAILRDPVTRPSSLRSDCPPELEAVVLKAMSRDPAQRYQSAEEMSRALAEVRAGSRSSGSQLARLSDPPPRTSGVVRTQRRRTIDTRTLNDIRVQAAPVGATSKRSARMVTVIGAVVASAATIGLWASQRDEKSIVATPLASTAPQPAAPQTFAEGSAPSAKTDRAPAAPAPARAAPAANAGPQTAPSAVTEPPPLAPAPTRAPSEQRSRVTFKPANAAPARAQVEPAREPVDVQALMKRASSAYLQGRAAEARSLYQEVVRSAPQQADAWRGLGLASGKLGDRADAARAFQRYLALRPSAPDAPRIRDQLAKVQTGSP